jgi:hypothetical protein
MILMEASSSADRRGLLAVGTPPSAAEETSGASTPRHTRVTAASIGMPVAGLSASGIGLGRSYGTGLCRRLPNRVSRRWRPLGRTSWSVWQVSSPGTWLADRGAPAGMPCVRGHGLDMKALPGGQATHEPIASQQMALWRRGGMLPQADLDPAHRRATRDLRRRRLALTRTRAALRAHLQPTHRQDHRPESGTTLADTAHRDGVAARCPAPAGQKRRAVDLARLGYEDPRLHALAWHSGTAAQPHDAQPGLGSTRCPAAGTSCASSCGLRSTTASVSPAGRRSSPLAASSPVPKNRRANATAPPGPRWALPIARGPARKRLGSVAGTIPPAKRT